VRFCGQDCQRANWKAHKPECAKLAVQRRATDSLVGVGAGAGAGSAAAAAAGSAASSAAKPEAASSAGGCAATSAAAPLPDLTSIKAMKAWLAARRVPHDDCLDKDSLVERVRSQASSSAAGSAGSASGKGSGSDEVD
jgi:hypothetical protein